MDGPVGPSNSSEAQASLSIQGEAPAPDPDVRAQFLAAYAREALLSPLRPEQIVKHSVAALMAMKPAPGARAEALHLTSVGGFTLVPNPEIAKAAAAQARREEEAAAAVGTASEAGFGGGNWRRGEGQWDAPTTFGGGLEGHAGVA